MLYSSDLAYKKLESSDTVTVVSCIKPENKLQSQRMHLKQFLTEESTNKQIRGAEVRLRIITTYKQLRWIMSYMLA